MSASVTIRGIGGHDRWNRQRRSKKDDPVAQASTDTGVRPNNETLFLLNLLAYEILHMGRTLMEKATREGWSLRRSGGAVLW